MRDTLIYTKLLKINNSVTIAEFTKRKQGFRVIINMTKVWFAVRQMQPSKVGFHSPRWRKASRLLSSNMKFTPFRYLKYK